MNRALWLLVRLRFKGWLRRLATNFRTVRGVLLTVFFGFLIFIWFVGLIAQAATESRSSMTSDGWAERFGPLLLLLYCVWSVASSSTQGPIHFTLPEVQFLFAGPFSRREILVYKLLTQMLVSFPLSLFISVVGRSMMGTWLGGWIGIFLILNFIQLFSVTFFLLQHAIDLRAYSRLRQFLIGTVLAGLVISLFYSWRLTGGFDHPLDMLRQAEASPIVQYGLEPLRWFFRVWSATQFDGRFMVYVGLSLLVNVLLFVAVLRLDSYYLETAARIAARRAAILERLRHGGLANASAPELGRAVRSRWPNPPWLWGAGPIFWRQCVTAWRSRLGFPVLVVTTVIALGGMGFSIVTSEKGIPASLPWAVVATGLTLSLMLNHAVAFDFRADLDRIEVLKSLPLSSWQVSMAQLLVPTVILSAYQIIFTVLVFAVFGEIGWLVVAVALLSWPVNLLLVGIENALFLIFPTRVAPATPGDFTQAFRQMATMFVKVIGLAIGFLLMLAAGGLANWLTGGSRPVTLVVAWVAAVGTSLLPVPFVAYAFDRFDVARDTPP